MTPLVGFWSFCVLGWHSCEVAVFEACSCLFWGTTTSAWWTSRSIMAAARTGSLKTSLSTSERFATQVTHDRGSFPSGLIPVRRTGWNGFALRRGCSRLRRLDEKRDTAESGELRTWRRPWVWACASRPTGLRGGGESDSMSGPGTEHSDPDADPQMGLAGAGWTQEHHVFSCSDEMRACLVVCRGFGLVGEGGSASVDLGDDVVGGLGP